jgi:hypothetical protein
MVGRGLWNDVWGMLGTADTDLFGREANPCRSRAQAVDEYLRFVRRAEDVRVAYQEAGEKPPAWTKTMELAKPLQRLFTGAHGGKKLRQAVDTLLHGPKETMEGPPGTLTDTFRRLLDDTVGREPREVSKAAEDS